MKTLLIAIATLLVVSSFARADLVKVGAFGTDGTSNYNTIENNTMYSDGHTTIDGFTHYNVIRNNKLHNYGFKTDLQGEVTIASGSPAEFTKTNHGLATGNTIRLTTTGTLPTGLTPLTVYMVSVDTADTFHLHVNNTTTNVDTTESGSGIHTMRSNFDPDPVNLPGAGKFGHRTFDWDSTDRAGNDFNLIEGNRFGHASANPNNNGQENVALSSGSNIFRYNASYGADGPGLYFKNDDAARNNRVYNNTMYSNGLYTGQCDENYPSCSGNANIKYGIRYLSTTITNVVKNNLLYANVAGDLACGADVCQTNNTLTNNWCADELTGCTEAYRGVDPKFTDTTINQVTNFTLPDLTLQSSSTAINGGAALTTASAAGDNNATLHVADALYFQDGTWGSDLTRTAGTMQADWIAIGTVSNVVQISSINYATNTITLASAMTWDNGASVWLYKKSDGTRVLYGSAPDYGAYEYAPPQAVFTGTSTGTIQ